jgi:hypothetical protein
MTDNKLMIEQPEHDYKLMIEQPEHDYYIWGCFALDFFSLIKMDFQYFD